MPTSHSSLPDDTWLRHFSGDPDPKVQQDAAAWRDADPEAYDRARLAWELSAGREESADTERFLERLRPQLKGVQRPIRPHARSRTPNTRKWPAMSMMSVGVAIASLVLGSIPAYRVWTRSAPSQTAAVQEHASAPGQRLRLQLPDGTTVLLNSSSRIRYAADIGITSRAVELDGEALFTVSQYAGMPFEVKSGNVITRVLGTVFAVRKYADDTSARIVVAQGKVMAGSTVLTSGESAVGLNDGNVMRELRTNMTNALAWTTGQLVLDYIPLQDAVRDMERWFAITIEITDPALARQPLHVAFSTETPQQAMSAIATVLHARATWQGETVRLSPITHSGVSR